MTTKPCPECEGQGQRNFERVCRASASNPYGDIESYMAECDNCSGTGEIDDDGEDEIDMCDRDEYSDWMYERAKDRRMEDEIEARARCR
ncbi:hypothetical protein UFOVP1202_40 [uncultured Caudovirales phage]|uniref:Uncharacterized protein n=1 Tax=uncultured Caudovirales phage TaxID=2100421 RepID=A0A6J5R0S1_9CAUD|nr:hypothetical protein UFOVP1202_40 [uncultured Caudovirales phage]